MYFEGRGSQERKPERRPLFEMGQQCATPGALAALGHDGVELLLARHVFGSWGEISEEDMQANVEAIFHGARILSAYTVDDRENPEEQVRVYVITEADRSSTTVLLCSEY